MDSSMEVNIKIYMDKLALILSQFYETVYQPYGDSHIIYVVIDKFILTIDYIKVKDTDEYRWVFNIKMCYNNSSLMTSEYNARNNGDKSCTVAANILVRVLCDYVYHTITTNNHKTSISVFNDALAILNEHLIKIITVCRNIQ